MTAHESSLLNKLYRKVLYPAYQRSPDPLYRLIDTYLYRNDSPLGGPGYYREYLRWLRHIRRCECREVELPHKLSVILLSFSRMKNMRLIVRGLLNLPFVETVVVSNNNPAVHIEKWIGIKDPRLRLINQPRRTAPGIRDDAHRGCCPACGGRRRYLSPHRAIRGCGVSRHDPGTSS